jgi:polyhydroxyalkanoate synthesis regulator phasin
VNKAWQRYLEAASGLTETTQHRAEQVVKSLVRQGELAAERAEKAVDDLLKRSEQNRKAFSAIVRSETEKAVGRLGLARQADLDRLERKLDRIERDLRAGTAKKAAKKKKASKSSAKKTASKRAAKKSTGGARA